MIQVNLMNLCEIRPKSAYKWFMELYIDSSDWVMTLMYTAWGFLLTVA